MIFRSPLLLIPFIGTLPAATVGFADITASTTMPISAFTSSSFSVDKIVDGITSDVSPFNGFASDSIGVITLNLSQEFTLSSFLLWNDINVNAEGIDGFELRFFDVSDTLITVPFSTSFNGPIGQLPPQEYLFPAPVADVKSVELEITSTQSNFFGPPRVEIREVDFGVVPEPSSSLLLVIASFALVRRYR